MGKVIAKSAEIERLSLGEFSERAYLDYSMYVILDRALPHITDGLKPVQRRIIYAMSELGLRATAKYKKSARTVGDVLGKFHPHGDMACYEAMVLMAQDFSYRYPFVDGQGNWGSSDDPKSFAAMRYTESRLTPFAQALLNELPQGTTDWKLNFDGTLKEPVLLPARLPNVLLNGASGIAVGISTDIPPHNLVEIVTACQHVLEHPEATLADILEHIQGPDYPTAAEIITSAAEIKNLYATGHGSIRMRATYIEENGDIVITALPYQGSGAKVMEQIAAQMSAKKLPNVSDLRDESDHENPIRLVITPRSNRVDIDALMLHLFATTDLERTYRVNLNMIGVDGRPKVKNLLEIIREWLAYRQQTVRRRLQFRLEQVLERLHILAGLLIVYLHLDEVIAIIRREDDAKAVLMKKFQLTAQQADAILDIKLRQLAKLEEIKIRDEQKSLNNERDELEKTLSSTARLTALIHQELQHDKETYGDARRSAIVARAQAAALREEEIIPSEAVTVILSKQGWVRVAKGHDIVADSLSYRAGDEFLAKAYGRSNQMAIFLDSLGKSYALAAHKLPSARGQGDPLTAKLTPGPQASFVAVLMGEETQKVVLASDAGYGFVTELGNLITKNRAGKAILKLPPQAHVLAPQKVEDQGRQYLAAATSQGHLLMFPLAQLPELPRGKGNKIIAVPRAKQLAREEYCVAIAVLSENDNLIIMASKRKLTLSWKELLRFQGERGRRGSKLPQGLRYVTQLHSNNAIAP